MDSKGYTLCCFWQLKTGIISPGNTTTYQGTQHYPLIGQISYQESEKQTPDLPGLVGTIPYGKIETAVTTATRSGRGTCKLTKAEHQGAQPDDLGAPYASTQEKRNRAPAKDHLLCDRPHL